MSDENQEIENEELENEEIENEEIENEELKNEEKDGFILELGDIIEIIAPSNDILNNQTYYINYINTKKIDLINVSTYQIEKLNIDDNGLITDESITEINLLSRSEEKGYARQKNLLPKTWLDIHFGGEIPTIITGEITNLEEDEIEIRTFPQEETIFINFEYKGLPEDIPIEKIIIRDPPRSALIDRMDVEGEPELNVVNEEASITYTDLGESVIYIPDDSTPDENIHEVLQSVYLNANELFGEDLEEIFQVVEIPDSEKRYGIDLQVNDFTDELLSTIPNNKRTSSVMSRVYRLVERFKELRQIFSSFDTNGNVINKKIYGDLYKPIIQNILNLDTKFRWLLPVVQQKKKIYEQEEDLIMNNENDIIKLNNNNDLLNQDDTQSKYYKNRILGEQNDYEYLLQTNNDFMTPFIPPIEEEEILIFNKEIKTDLEAIVNNLGDFFSTTISKINKTDSYKFKYFLQKYNLGSSRVHSIETRNNQKVYIRNKVTPNDKISVKSIIMLPEPVISYSRIDLPSTNILTKTNLSMNNLDYFKVFIKNKDIKQKIIMNLENEIDYEKENPEIFKEITEFVLDDTITNDDEKYKKFLNVIFPKIRVLIRLMRDSIHNKFSFMDVVKLLEPFMIYPDNITYGQYNEIRFFIKEKIKDYKVLMNEKSNQYNIFKNTNFPVKNFINKIYFLLSENVELQETFIGNYYDTSNKNSTDDIKNYEFLKRMSSSELLNSIINTDQGKLYSNLLTFLLLSLITPDKLLQMGENVNFDNIDKYEKIGEKNCIRRFLTKKYNSISELQKDNNVDVLYYDKEYDDTPYSILKKYENEKKIMLPDKFIGFLAENLVQKHDCPRNMSEEMAKTLITGKKEIRDGEYAILYIKPTLQKELDSEKLTDKEKKEIEIEENVKTYYHYYKRLGNNWIRDNEIDEEAFFDTQSLFCNIDFKCHKNQSTNTCDSTKSAEMNIKNITSKRAFNEFDKRFSITVEELTKKLEKNIDFYKYNLKKNKLIKENQLYKSNFISYEIGKYANKDELISSPYIKLYDLILSQSDFSKKQMDICKFVLKFCREPMDGENPHWFFCRETNTYLVPQSIFQLAETFILEGDYILKLEELCHEVGEISDDGCSWIDKYCGCELKKMDFVDEAEFTETGFKIISNSIIEKDLGTVANDAFMNKENKKKEPRVFEDETTYLTYNIFHAIAMNIDIPSEAIESFVMRVSMEIIMNSDIVLSEASYMKRAEKIEKTKGKIQAPYKTYKHQTIITIVGGILLIAIQTVIPSFKVKKTFPGCVLSFSGFPMDGGVEDMSGLKYISCVIQKLKSPISPWDSIEKLSASIIEKRIKEIMERFIIQRNDIVELYLKKKEYLLLNPEILISREHSVLKWKHFLPPILEFNIIQNIQGVTHEFNKDFVDLLRRGNKDQHTSINIYKSKNILHSYAVVESINKIVKSKELLLKTTAKIPFLENACCNEEGITHPISYFIHEDKNIDLFLKRCIKNESILKNVKSITEASLLIYNENTKIQYPAIPTEWMEVNIYKTFIFYCHFDNDIPIPDDLLILCREKPNGYNKYWSIEEKMEFLKKHGKRYSLGDLNQLLQIVHKRNMNGGPIQNIINPILIFREYLEHLESNNSKIIEEPLRKLLFQLLDVYSSNKMVDENDKEQTPFNKAIMRLRNYLIKTNERMYNKIISFVDKYGNLSSKKFDDMQEKILNVMKWDLDRNIKESGLYYDDGLYTITQFVKNSIYHITKVFPQEILNNVSYNNVHKHWGLSKEHMNDIENFVRQHAIDLNKYKKNTVIQKLLQSFSSSQPSFTEANSSISASSNWVVDIEKFVHYIPIHTSIEKDGILFFSLFDKRTIYLLYTYCWYSVFYEMIELTNDSELLKLDIKESKQERRNKINESKDESNYIHTDVNNNDTLTEYEDEVLNIEILSGDKLELQQNVCAMLLDFINIEYKNKKTLDIPYPKISRKTKKTKEAEKKSITDFLQNLEKDERNIENQLKKFKMGRWNLGMQKGIFQYDKKLYDDNRDANLARLYEDIEYNELENTEPNSLDVHDLDAIDEQENNNLYDNEGMDISGLAEDYGDGNYYEEDTDRDFGYDD